MLGALTCLVVPVVASDHNHFLRNTLGLFVWAIIIDLLSGATLGLSASFIVMEIFICSLYSRKFELGRVVKIIIGTLGAIVYFYVSRRFFW